MTEKINLTRENVALDGTFKDVSLGSMLDELRENRIVKGDIDVYNPTIFARCPSCTKEEEFYLISVQEGNEYFGIRVPECPQYVCQSCKSTLAVTDLDLLDPNETHRR